MPTKPEVCIVESLDFFDEDRRKEGEAIYRGLRLCGKDPHYIYVRNRIELLTFLSEFSNSDYRYLHISCHGHRDGMGTTVDGVSFEDISSALSGCAYGRRLFLSTCYAGGDKFAETFFKTTKFKSVLAPRGKIAFQDASVFWAAFYYKMFKADSENMTSDEIKECVKICAGVTETRFRYYFRRRDNMDRIYRSMIPESEGAFRSLRDLVESQDVDVAI